MVECGRLTADEVDGGLDPCPRVPCCGIREDADGCLEATEETETVSPLLCPFSGGGAGVRIVAGAAVTEAGLLRPGDGGGICVFSRTDVSGRTEQSVKPKTYAAVG